MRLSSRLPLRYNPHGLAAGGSGQRELRGDPALRPWLVPSVVSARPLAAGAAAQRLPRQALSQPHSTCRGACGREGMKPKAYLETTVVSYLTARTTRDLIVAAHQKLTRDWWHRRRKRFDLYCSQLVIREAAAGDKRAAKRRLEVLDPLPLLEITNAARQLARDLATGAAIPQEGIGRRTPHCARHGSRDGLPPHLELQTHCQCRDSKRAHGCL